MVKIIPNSAVYVDICDLGAFQKYLTRCARAVFSKSLSITNIYIPASFSIAYYRILSTRSEEVTVYIKIVTYSLDQLEYI